MAAPCKCVNVLSKLKLPPVDCPEGFCLSHEPPAASPVDYPEAFAYPVNPTPAASHVDFSPFSSPEDTGRSIPGFRSVSECVTHKGRCSGAAV
ncbi:hypothetical protein O181_124390 [Austropuccinia psidii MF-1]|uniref:Uncharacterized protein n=1 Tax=Austropuccinia psidii MF-1 TaxID=1389203 RepID=A0A9Q3Q548_9BASI|nr:hypothetical protein [Austropuccinia psidii MF-1]